VTSYAHFANRHGERKRKEEQGCEMFAVQMKCQGPSEAEPVKIMSLQKDRMV